ncbi:class I SAM-dependent methyltransferase [Actinomadura chokoriensis]|uniref:class I SAM-dependent methyltransferase n=1 Tax=Actinomadura chokoriensis TaxID=454156 RepID=UPI0031F8F5DE
MRDAANAPSTGGYDAELRRYNEVLRRAVAVQPHHHILDIGCGAGQTTRDAARAAREGSVLGVDVSAPAIDRARELARADGLDNVTFRLADAQVHRFPPERFDLAMSRFGTMFFADPAAAFANINRALRPGGRLVMLVWQAPEHNEWDVVIRRALAEPEEPLAPDRAGPDAFSLSDPSTVREVLRSAGFTDIAITDVREPVYYGPNVDAALEWIRGFTCTNEALKRLDPAAATRATERLRDMLATHLTDDGICFDSRAWTVTAHHP